MAEGSIANRQRLHRCFFPRHILANCVLRKKLNTLRPGDGQRHGHVAKTGEGGGGGKKIRTYGLTRAPHSQNAAPRFGVR